MIYPVDGGYVISSHGSWLPGVYESERAARYAFRFSNEELVQINAARGADQDYRPITVECLHEWRYGRSVADTGQHTPAHEQSYTLDTCTDS